MNHKFKKDGLKGLIIESILIIFSVMLGLLANDFRASLNKNEAAKLAWQNIRNEISINSNEVRSSLDKQKQLMLRLNKLTDETGYFTKSEQNFYDVLHKAGGINFPDISTVAWETAKDRGIIESFDYNRLLLLTSINENTAAIRNIDEKILGIIYNKDMFSIRYADDVAKTIRITLADLMQSERNLLGSYDKLKQKS